MNQPDGLVDTLEQYRAGLEAEIAVLKQLQHVAARQRGVTERRDFDQLAAASDERDRLMRVLVSIERGLQDVRARLSRGGAATTALPGYRHVVVLRQEAIDLVASILSEDEESMRSLADADLARRAAVASLERGETTLAAYRRVLTPALSPAALLDRRG